MDKDQKKEKKVMGTLYLVSTSIGNDDDITLRALDVLKNSDLVVCEEPKVGGRILKVYNLTQRMELLNEQNEQEMTFEIMKYLKQGKKIALISDCGTPVFADPGKLLVKAALQSDQVNIVVVPGATSIMTALVRSGFDIDKFLYAGFLDRDRSVRFEEIIKLRDEPRTVVLLETPYRLMPVLEAFKALMPERRAYIGCNLTMKYETHHYGTFEELYNKFSDMHFKGEFVIVFEKNHFMDQMGFRIVSLSAGKDDWKPNTRDKKPYSREKDSRSYSRGSGGSSYSGNRGRKPYSKGQGGKSYSKDSGGRPFSKDQSGKSHSKDSGGRPFSKDQSGKSHSKDSGSKSYSKDSGAKSYSKSSTKGKNFNSKNNRDYGQR
jgi:16S rRNA (cytidine1402-2'-O)-methyltransferase